MIFGLFLVLPRSKSLSFGLLNRKLDAYFCFMDHMINR